MALLLALLALPACDGGEPPAAAPPEPGGAALLRDVTEASKLAFRHDAGVSGGYAMTEIVGAGGALFDADGDGDLDVYLVGGADPAGGASPPRHRLFARQPDGTYRDATAASGLGHPGTGMGVAVGDVDNDGRPDVYVTHYGPDALFANRGGGSFAEVTAAAALPGTEGLHRPLRQPRLLRPVDFSPGPGRALPQPR